jgi:hypothetical protein
MTDISQGPGCWIASDGKWYRPEQHPNYVPPPPPPQPTTPTSVSDASVPKRSDVAPGWWRDENGSWHSPSEPTPAIKVDSGLWSPSAETLSAPAENPNSMTPNIDSSHEIADDSADDAEGEKVVYATDGWTTRQRAGLTKKLLDADVIHEWRGSDLTVHSEDRPLVDSFLHVARDEVWDLPSEEASWASEPAIAPLVPEPALLHQPAPGAGWWLASDGKWYAPELHPDYRPPPPPRTYTPPHEPEHGQSPPVAGTAPQSQRSGSTLPAGAWFSILGGSLMAIGCFLPWLSASVYIGGGLSRNAFQLGDNLSFSIDGVIGVGLGAIAMVIGIARLTNSSMPRFIQSSSAVVGIGGAILVANRWQSLSDVVQKAQSVLGGLGNASLGAGIYMVAVGAGLSIIGGVILRTSTPRQAW